MTRMILRLLTPYLVFLMQFEYKSILMKLCTYFQVNEDLVIIHLLIRKYTLCDLLFASVVRAAKAKFSSGDILCDIKIWPNAISPQHRQGTHTERNHTPTKSY